MSFYINGNLSPLEAVRQHKFLQVNPAIEQWAQAAEMLDEVIATLEKICDDDNLKSAKQVKQEIRENILSMFSQ